MTAQFPFLEGAAIQSQRDLLQQLEESDYISILTSAAAKILPRQEDFGQNEAITRRIGIKHIYNNVQRTLQEGTKTEELYLSGLAALQAFLQSNVTGPPISFRPSEICFPGLTRESLDQQRKELISDLTVDGEAIYGLTPHIELFALAKVLLNHDDLPPTADSGAWARVRVNFWHQKMLSEVVSSLQDSIYKDLAYLEGFILGSGSTYSGDAKALFLLERAAIHMHHGLDNKARDDIEEASRLRHFQYALTGRLGKRTKFQQNDLSQLVVLARSHNSDAPQHINGDRVPADLAKEAPDEVTGAPKEIELNDDTLLDRISFTAKYEGNDDAKEELPRALAELDPAAQPILNPIDATALLSFASSVTNTSPEDGLSREETLPYATRVLEGGSSNWQVYTQALLVRSRVEGYKSRTVERGALQLQALVDQVIAETSGNASATESDGNSETTTFLPRAKPSESAPASERLTYIHQLNTPPRWALEAELASRWASLGGLRTALEIYVRLEMWAEASLCLAATEDEGKAIRMVRRQLFQPAATSNREDGTAEGYDGPERSPLPPDAPRLFCILGDLETNPAHWKRAWSISNNRYSRAQRSLGKYYVRNKQLPAADEAYEKSLATNPQNASTWFALGCVRLELQNWRGAVIAFQRCVHLEPEDAEAWSNLAATLLQLPADEPIGDVAVTELLDDEDSVSPAQKKPDPQKHSREAFLALKRAATLKRDSFRIWQNVLNVGARLVPPPYSDILVAQTRLIELRSGTEGEGCVDAEVLEGILQHIITLSAEAPNNANADGTGTRPKHGISRMFAELLHNRVIPLITHSRRLWQLAARFALYEGRPGKALDAYEKAWRVTLNQPGWDGAASAAKFSSKSASHEPLSPDAAWQAVLDATDELVSAYESLGEREASEGLKAGSGELVCKNWRFKARSAIRAVVGRRTKAGLEGEDVEGLKRRMEELKG